MVAIPARTRRCQKYGHPKYEKPFEFKFKNFGWGYRSLAADTRGVVIQRAEQAGGDGGALARSGHCDRQKAMQVDDKEN